MENKYFGKINELESEIVHFEKKDIDIGIVIISKLVSLYYHINRVILGYGLINCYLILVSNLCQNRQEGH